MMNREKNLITNKISHNQEDDNDNDNLDFLIKEIEAINHLVSLNEKDGRCQIKILNNLIVEAPKEILTLEDYAKHDAELNLALKTDLHPATENYQLIIAPNNDSFLQSFCNYIISSFGYITSGASYVYQSVYILVHGDA